ncbi:MAG: DUF2868 domain-containing protein [Deltaproteobacteria bacterium]|nr:DUF2868 domain-containing protein [Deltaproteobacteria bacterium]
MKKPVWHIKDLIDLDYFLRSDEREWDESAQTSLAKRDREIYLKHIQPLEHEGQSQTPKNRIRAWLEQRRNLETSESGSKTVLPGEAFEEINRLLGYGLLIAGVIIGAGLAFSFLDYRGTEPLNVSVYMGSFIFTQVFLILLLLGMSLIRIWRRLSLRSSVVYVFISGLVSALIMKIKRRALKTLPGSRRDSFEAVMGLVKGKRRIYGSLFYWPVFLQAQICMIGFNLGLLGATLLKVMGSDIAFGWQSTVQVSAGWVFKLVKAVALPWSWLVPPEIAYPSLSRIAGSHMVLKDGIYRLATEDLVAWWPFLCFAVLCYGVLPRLILATVGLVSRKRAVDRIDFGHSACERLLHRLRTPVVGTDGRPVDAERPGSNEQPWHDAPLSAHENTFPDSDLIVLIPAEIFEMCPDDELEKVVTHTFGFAIRETLRFGEDEAGDQKVLDDISLIKAQNASPNLLILQEAWQPPIKENVRFIRELRKAAGNTAKLKVGLIGRPDPDRFFTRVKEEDWKAWLQKMKALGDPYLGLERLVLNDGKPGS